MKYIFILMFTCSLFVGLTQSPPRIQNQEFEKKLQSLLSHDVPEMSCDELHKNYNEFILLDTREWKEYAVSHLKNAKWVGYKSFDSEALIGFSKSAKIVCYCSVGYRSERIAKKLKASGYSNVYNLYGSIFEWINCGYPVYNNTLKEVKQVHGYNKKWSRWVFNKEYQPIY